MAKKKLLDAIDKKVAAKVAATKQALLMTIARNMNADYDKLRKATGLDKDNAGDPQSDTKFRTLVQQRLAQHEPGVAIVESFFDAYQDQIVAAQLDNMLERLSNDK